MKRKNILLTSLGYTYDHSRHSYFRYEEGGVSQYCEGISMAEAGSKYVLSRVPIDKIIVLGPPSAIHDENVDEEVKLRDYCDFGADLPERYSEYKFFCYRIMQYMNRIDIEGNDLLDQGSPEEKESYRGFIHTFCVKYGLKEAQDDSCQDIFWRLDQNPSVFQKLLDEIGQTSSVKRRWFKHYLYMLMDRDSKMSSLSENEEITVQFLPTAPKGESNLRMGNLPGILDYLMQGQGEEIHVYVDLQGMDIADSHTLLNVLFMMEHEKSKCMTIEEVIMTTYRAGFFTNPIENQKNRLELNELLSGMDAFLQFGKVDSILSYWEKRPLEDAHIKRLLYAMRTVDVGITLCSISDLEQGIRMLKRVFADEERPRRDLDGIVFGILEDGIKQDYGKLLIGEELDIPALIRWAMKKHFYQQALTIIESLVPHDIVSSGIFYYARNEEDLAQCLTHLNETYWSAAPKDRYQFDDLEHYFVKFYRRREAYRKKPKFPAEAYLKLRLDEVYDPASEIKAYTRYQGAREELHEFLMGYLQIGNIRNQISHAQEVNLSYEEWDMSHENEKVSILQTAIQRFMDSYDKVKKGLNPGAAEPYCIGQEEFKDYCKSHAISWEELKQRKEK